MKPISPDELTSDVPEFVIGCVNKLIKENWDHISKEAVVSQTELIEEIISAGEKCGEYTNSNQIFYTGWLHFEDMYRAAGWTVRNSWNASSEKMEHVFAKKE